MLITVLISINLFCLAFAQDTIEGRWHLVGYEDAIMYQFVDTEPFADAGLRYSIYVDENGEFDDLDGDNIGGTPHPYSVVGDIITIDTHFGNILSYQMNYRCEGQVVDFYFYEDDLDRDYLVERWNFLAQPYNVSRHLHVPKKIVFPLKQGRINDINFNIPYDIDACCRYLYGENYKTPLNKETQYDVKIVNNKPVIIKKYNGIVTVPKIPIFIIVKDKQEALKMAIKSFYANIKTPFEIVIYNNNSSCTKTIKFLRDLEKSGTKIYWNQASDAKSVDVRVKEWMSENYSSDNYFITDTDASFIKSGVS